MIDDYHGTTIINILRNIVKKRDLTIINIQGVPQNVVLTW